MNRVLRHLRSTFICALIVASVLSAVVLIISIITGVWYFEKFHSSTWGIIRTYYLGAVLIALAIGPLTPFARHAPVAVLLGMIGGCILYSLAAHAIEGRINWGLGIGLGCLLGGPVGLFISSNIRSDLEEEAKQRRPQQPKLLTEAERRYFDQSESILLYGSPKELEIWIDFERCMVVDHRSEEQEVVEDAARWLPENYLTGKWVSHNPHQFLLQVGTQSVVIEILEQPGNCWRVLYHIAQLIRPDFEIRAFGYTLGDDTQAFLIRPKHWWAAFDEKFPERRAMIFEDVDGLLPLWRIEDIASSSER